MDQDEAEEEEEEEQDTEMSELWIIPQSIDARTFTYSPTHLLTH